MPGNAQDSWPEALDVLQRTLQFLDRVDAPGDVRAHVDLAIWRFADQLNEQKAGYTPTENG